MRAGMGWLLAVIGLALAGCGETRTELIAAAVVADGGDGAGDGAASPGAGADAAAQDPGEPRAPVLCGDRPCACDNGVDDDGDGDVDGLDAECTGPFDDDEATFATGIPGGNVPFCKDCFWDDNSGSEDDGCQVHADCLQGNVPATVAGSACFDCEVSPACVDSCQVRTPNGCDCFGCCEVTRRDGSQVHVLLQDSCSLQQVDDEVACPRCVQNPVCRNECGVCELCPGKKQRDLPQTCRGMGREQVDNRCDEGQQVCDGDRPCPADYWCQLGCCIYIPQ